MDADSYLHGVDQDLKNYQDISIEELTRDQQGKMDFYENIQKIQEQISTISYIIKNIADEKNELDYGLGNKVDDMKINTLKYIAEHLLERIHLMESLQTMRRCR